MPRSVSQVALPPSVELIVNSIEGYYNFGGFEGARTKKRRRKYAHAPDRLHVIGPRLQLSRRGRRIADAVLVRQPIRRRKGSPADLARASFTGFTVNQSGDPWPYMGGAVIILAPIAVACDLHIILTLCFFIMASF
jgi:hypothetical protein